MAVSQRPRVGDQVAGALTGLHRAALGVSLAMLSVTPTVVTAQPALREYPVKFVCGRRAAPAAATSAAFDAVAPGLHFTAVNIHNPTRGTIAIRTRIATTVATPVGGLVIPGPALTLAADQALEFDCADFLRLAGTHQPAGVQFVKGFVLLVAEHELDVVAVYSAGTRTGITTLDIESVGPRRAPGQTDRRCPDLVIGRIDRPTYPDGRTRVTLAVGNIGDVDATNVVVYLEDPGGTGPERIVQTTVPLIAAGAWVIVTMEFTYSIQGNARVAAIVAIVDPKNDIAECDETNNRRTLGAQ